MMNRRNFLVSSAAATLMSSTRLHGQAPREEHHLPPKALGNDSPGVKEEPVPEYRWASDSAYEAFRDMKFGVRIHWGMYSIWHDGKESWPYLGYSYERRAQYNELYKSFNPTGFDANEWMNLFEESGMKMFAFTTKHHEGFSMYDTKTRVRSRVNYTAPGGPKMEECDLAYSVMESPFKRDIVKELCDAARKKNIKIDLYFSHIDFYDADFRPYSHPLQVPSSIKLTGEKNFESMQKKLGDRMLTVPDPSPAEVTRMMARHRAQLIELLTNYGEIDMMCLDLHFGPAVWPEMRKTVLQMRAIQPNVMLRNRGIGAYGDYYTPEQYFPTEEQSDAPWFVIYPLGTAFSYEADAAKHKGTGWIIQSLVDSVSKGGNFMVGIGSDMNGQFHPEAQRQIRAAGAWLRVNGEAIYATRARSASTWFEGETVRYTSSKDRRTVYAIATQWPGKELLLTKVQPQTGSEIHMLGYPQALKWSYDSSRGLSILLPENLQDADHRPCEFSWCFRIKTDAA
jgi:alpha-L-fucosidase